MISASERTFGVTAYCRICNIPIAVNTGDTDFLCPRCKGRRISVIGGRAGWKIASHNFRLMYPNADIEFIDTVELPKKMPEDEYFIGVGGNDQRKHIHKLLKDLLKKEPLNSIHPTALHEACRLGHGNLLMPYSVINPDATIGNCTIINTGAIIEHDVEIHDYAQISPNATISGYAIIKEGAFIGSGAVILPGVVIGEWAVIGAGSTVTKEIKPNTTYAGCPRNPYKKRRKK